MHILTIKDVILKDLSYLCRMLAVNGKQDVTPFCIK